MTNEQRYSQNRMNANDKRFNDADNLRRARNAIFDASHDLSASRQRYEDAVKALRVVENLIKGN